METLAFGLACNQVSPCAFTASPRQRSHPHGLLSQSPCALTASLWRCLHSHEQPTIVVGLPSLSGCHHCQAAIVVGLPSLLGCHCCWAVVVVGLLLRPYSLRLPPNGLFLLGYIVGLFSWAAFERPICCHWAVTVALFRLVQPIVCVPG